MSRQSEIDKIVKVLARLSVNPIELAVWLIDSGIRSKDGFEIDDECINDKGREYHVFIKPKEYKEEHGD